MHWCFIRKKFIVTEIDKLIVTYILSSVLVYTIKSKLIYNEQRYLDKLEKSILDELEVLQHELKLNKRIKTKKNSNKLLNPYIKNIVIQNRGGELFQKESLNRRLFNLAEKIKYEFEYLAAILKKHKSNFLCRKLSQLLEAYLRMFKITLTYVILTEDGINPQFAVLTLTTGGVEGWLHVGSLTSLIVVPTVTWIFYSVLEQLINYYWYQKFKTVLVNKIKGMTKGIPIIQKIYFPEKNRLVIDVNKDVPEQIELYNSMSDFESITLNEYANKLKKQELGDLENHKVREIINDTLKKIKKRKFNKIVNYSDFVKNFNDDYDFIEPQNHISTSPPEIKIRNN